MPSLGRGGTMRGPTAFWRALERARRENLRDAGEAMPLAGSAATAALPRPARALAGGGGPVVIIGGGIAGLSARWHLTQAGIDARLYEARTRLGGRMYTARAKGQPAFEIGGQLVNTDHADMHELCREFGVSLIDRKGGPPPPASARAGRGSAAVAAIADSTSSTCRRVWPSLPAIGIASPASRKFSCRARSNARQNAVGPRIVPPRPIAGIARYACQGDRVRIARHT